MKGPMDRPAFLRHLRVIIYGSREDEDVSTGREVFLRLSLRGGLDTTKGYMGAGILE